MTRIDAAGHWLAPLGLRAILAWEFFESGREKLLGENWFDQLAGQFPPPFSLLSANLNWTLATWLELLGAAALLLGLGTRFVAYALIVLTVVATYAVHWPTEWAGLAELWQGYAVTDNGYGNFKLPLLYLIMLLPLLLRGAGPLSLDGLLMHRWTHGQALPAVATSDAGHAVWSALLILLGLPIALLLPWAGGALIAIGIALAVLCRARR
ncbi:DoxX family protein [Cupriavidus sp. UGS-1]|uniref:HvfX family Cu-binding RiPP maturation protein n=1 Tax=Cupriavidus sp. UGS-1 TaxID=2899826 RepID=UPI001E33FBFA|nr:DoxX family protein [Cupriavidus sp. UGS-1]MCD9123546.1 DoxX family protein [Cupriavidus sp. UGS-1]